MAIETLLRDAHTLVQATSLWHALRPWFKLFVAATKRVGQARVARGSASLRLFPTARPFCHELSQASHSPCFSCSNTRRYHPLRPCTYSYLYLYLSDTVGTTMRPTTSTHALPENLAEVPFELYVSFSTHIATFPHCELSNSTPSRSFFASLTL